MKKLCIRIGVAGCVRVSPEDTQTLTDEWGDGMDQVMGDFIDSTLVNNFRDNVANWQLFRRLNMHKLLHKYEATLSMASMAIERWAERLEMDKERNFKNQEAIRREEG